MARDSRIPRVLVIVSPDHLYLVALARKHFTRDDRVEVIVDRRRRERRTAGAPVPGDRRRRDRRQQDISAELRSIGWTMARPHPARPPDPTRPWHLPWLRVELLLRTLLGTRWGGEAWPTTQATLRGALRARGRIRQEGWFN